jgi:hypothetical protein
MIKNIAFAIGIILLAIISFTLYQSIQDNSNEISLLNQSLENSIKGEADQNTKIDLYQPQIEKLKKTHDSELIKLNSQIDSLGRLIKKSSSTNSYLSSQIRALNKKFEEVSKEKEETRLKLIASLNKTLTSIFDKRLKKTSMFNDDSSFSYLVGRRNYLENQGQNTFEYSKTVHFSATGQYLQQIYQDKDNGNNRFITTTYTFKLNNLDLNAASIEDKTSNSDDSREESYSELKIPVISGEIEELSNIEFNRRQFTDSRNVKELVFLTSNVSEAKEVLNILKLLSDHKAL